MDVNSRDPSQNIIPFRIKGVEVARFDICGNLGIGTSAPSAKLDVAGNVKISGDLFVNGRALNSLTSGVVINMDSQPAPATALNRQKKQSIPLAAASTLSTSDIIAKMSGVSVGKTQTYGVGAAQMASYGNIVVAVGSGTNSIAYSLSNPPTASSWVGIPTTTSFNGVASTFTTLGYNIAYANGTWVAVGEGTNSIAYSTMTPPVASSWVGIPTGSSFNGVVNTFGTRGYDIAYGNGAWVAVGVGTNSIAYSLANPPTAESWVAIPLSFSPTIFGSDVSGIIFGNGTWVATGSGTNGIAYSTRTPPTADSWVVVPLGTTNDASVANVSSTAGVNVIYAAGVWLAAGNGTNTLCYSVENPPIASSWMPITTGVLFGTSGRSLAYGNGTWVACGNSGTQLAYSTARIPHSSSWVAIKGPTPSSSGEVINHVGFNASTNTWYFLGDISSNCMFYSTATPPVPATWIGVQRSAGAFTTQAFGAVGITTPAFTTPINVARLDNKVTFPANRMIAVGGGGGGIDVVARSSASPAPATTGTISYSDDDGTTWSMVPGGATNAMFSSAADIAAGTSFGVGGSRGANTVAWNGEKWVAGGNGRTNSLAFSDDGGMTWTGITGKSVFSVEARDVAWNGQMWVAVGRGIVFSTAYSYDGVTWMGPVDASGVPVNVFSYDIGGAAAGSSDISGGGNHVVWTGKMWVATGTRTLIAGSSPAAYYTVAYSVDGKTWTGAADSGATSTGFDMYAYGAAWNGRNFVATGRGTVNTLAFSTDVTASTSSSWQGLGNTVFSVWGRGITWGARRWMATGRGTNTVAFSTNGRNWQGCGANVFKPLRRFMAMGDTGLYTGQRGVAFSYSDDGVTWDAPVVNQGVEDNYYRCWDGGNIPLYAFTSHTFTNAGATGSSGPSLSTTRTTYTNAGASWATTYLNMTSDNGIQLWTVPVTGLYTIQAAGAAGANHIVNSTSLVGVGLGSQITFNTFLTKGDVYAIVVGQRATPKTSGDTGNGGGSGGGGSFIWNNSNKTLIGAAGGGGGRAVENVTGSNTLAETYGLNGVIGTQATLFNYDASKTTYNSFYRANNGQSGGLWTSASSSGYTLTGGKGWNEMINSIVFTGRSSSYGSISGFGGGSNSADHGGGGGGGYSGGGSINFSVFTGLDRSGGGGGSSYAISSIISSGTNSSNENGSVIITLISGSGGNPSTLFTNNTLLTNAITDNVAQHTALMYSTDAGASWSRVPGSNDTEANGGTGMTTANNGCYSLAANPTRTRFIAGGGDSGSATKKVYLSNDGFNWNRSVSSPNATQFAWVWASLWVGGGYNRWLIGGNDVTTQANGRIMYSGDADAVGAWVVASPATYTGTIVSCFAANTDFSVILAGAASGNTIYRAANNGGATWTTVSISSTPLGGVRSIAFSPSLGRWVAVGGGSSAANTIIYSTDATATAWIAPPLQAKSATTAIFKNGSEATRVIWDALGGRFLVGGWNGASDYASLTNVAGLDGVNNNPGYTMAYSADGVNWTPVTVRADTATAMTPGSTPGSTSGPFMTRCREIMALDVSGEYTPINTGYSVTWNSYANRFVATGNGTTPVVYSSDGGVTWTAANQQPQQQAIAVAGGGGGAAGTGTISPITYTIDGKTWSQAIGAKEIFGASATVVCVKYGQTSTAISPNGRIWVAGALTGSNSCLAFSQNGIRWTAIASANTMITNVRTITYAPAEQIKGGASASTGAISNAALTAASGVGNGVWVAGGDTTNSLIFSYDGISWSEVPGSLAILNTCNACAFGNGVFVAGGSAGTTDTTAVLAYSTDGINWQPIRGTKSRISTSAVIQSITYGRDERGRGLWVAGVGAASGVPNIALLYSYNGIDWIGVTDSLTLSASINGIAYGVSATTGQGLWVASVYRFSSYSFLFSTTGRDGWTVIANTKSPLFEQSASGATGIAYLNGVWYATGQSAGFTTGRTLAYSYDGSGGWFGVYPSSNMYGTVIPTFSATGMFCVATTNEYMVPSVGAVPAAMVPIRSIGWTAGVGSAYLQHPAILFGASTASTASTAISADGGRSWGGSSLVSLSSSAFRGGVCNDAFWNGSIWAAVGYDAVSGAKVATSRDGVTWSQIPAAAVPISGVLYSIMWNGSVWMVGGDGSPTNDANTASIAWSTDLTIWNAVANTDTKLYLVKRISWNGMYWVAVGLGTVSTMMYSKDRNGLVWEDTYLSSSSTNKTASITSAVNDVVWGGGRWVAVGRGNDIVGGGGVSILYSADTPVVGGEPAEYAITGRRWTGVAASAQLFPYGATSVCWNGKRFVATGPAYSSKSGTAGNIIAWSADGISWTGYSTTKTVAPGQRWVAVGSGSAATIATSADGRVWTDVSGSALLFSDISGATTAVVNTMLTGARAIGWNGSSLIVGGARSATTMTDTSQLTATATTGRTTIPVCAFIGSGNGVMGGGTTNVPDASFQSLTMRTSSSVFITHLDVNMREASQPWANMWLNTYTDLSATQLFQVTPESQTFSSALKWNGWSWVANFGMTTFSAITGEQFGSIWYCTDPLARVGWSVASNYAAPRILMGQGGYAALEWNGAAWLACGYDPNNNNLIYTTDKYGATGWTAVTGIVSGGSASFQPVCIASSPRFWVVGGSLGTTSALYYTNDRTGATGWKAISTAGGASVLPGIRITSIGYNGSAWICCGGGGGGSGAPASSISWRADAGDDIGTGWAAATTSGSSGGIPPNMSNCSAVAYSTGAASPIWMVVGDTTAGGTGGDQIAYTSSLTGSIEWKRQTQGTLAQTAFCRLTGITWTGYSWIASCGAGGSRIVNTTDNTGSGSWNSVNLYSPTMFTNAVTYANIPISLLTTGMVSSTGVGAGSGAMWRGGVGRAQGLLPGGGSETTSVVVRSSNGAEGTTWSQTYSRNFLIAVGGGTIRDASGVGGTNRMAYSYDGGLSWTTNNTSVLTTASGSSVGSIRTVKYGNGMWVAGGDAAGSSGSGNNCLAWSRDGVNWTGAGGTQIFGSAGACYAVCCNDRGRWVAVGGAALTTAGTYTNVSGSIYTMAWSDDGMNWTPILGSRALFGIVCQGVSYGADASGVGMWTAIGRGGAYTGCAYSYDGKTWFLSQTSGSLFGTSVNVLTERYAPVASANWYGVSLSSTGQYQSAVIRDNQMHTSSDYGISWTPRSNSSPWFAVSLSSTGQYQTALVIGNKIHTSSDYGVTWTPRYNNANWVSVSISSTGQYQTVVEQGSKIQTSSDYGLTWTPRYSDANWVSVSISSTGQYQTAVIQGGLITTSSDYGLTWAVIPAGGNPANPGSLNCYSISLSSTGQYQTAVVNNGNIWTSYNYGVNWTERTTGATRSWNSISVSSTGQYQTAVVTLGTIWTSLNYGASWTERNVPGGGSTLKSISLSSTGQYQTAVVQNGLIFISSNFGETWSSGATDSRSLGVTYGKDASGAGMWVATAGRRDRDISANVANTMAYSYDGKLWRGITASAGLSEQAWSVAYGKDGFGVGMWVAGGYDRVCGLKWSYDGITWNATTGASGSAVWVGAAAGRRALSVYWNGSMWLASTSDTRNGEPRGTGIAANNASGVPGYLLYSYNGKNWLPVLAANTYASAISATVSVYSVLPNPAILDFGSFYDDQTQRGTTIANTTARTVGAVMSGGVPIENVNTIVPYGRGSLTTGQVPFLLGGDSGLMDTGAGAPPITSELAASTTSISTSTDGGITWRAVPNSTKVMTKVNKILCDETTQQIVAVGTGNYSVATSTPATAGAADGWVGVFGSRMTNTRAGLFEKYSTGATWFSGAKMWIASGRTQSRRGSSLAVSVNGTVWQDAKIVSQVAAGTSLGGRGGGLTSRTTTGVTMTSSVIPYTAPATPLLTYTDSAAAFSTQVSSVATNSQYNRAVVGGSGVQFVAGGRGGIAVSNDGHNWTAAASGTTTTVFQTPTNVAAYSTSTGSGGFDASFGTVALTQRLTVPATYPSGSYTGIAISSTGQYQAVTFSSVTKICTSSDYGITWTERESVRFWRCISISSTGQYQSAVAQAGNIYTSSDFGVSWTSRDSVRTWRSISISSTGQYQSACVYDTGTTGYIYTSSDYGITWTARQSDANRQWSGISVSYTGQYQSAVVYPGSVFISSDYGVSWTSKDNRNWNCISISSTGQYQTGGVNSNNLYTSSDFGISWTSRDSVRSWQSISLSLTGQYQSAVNNGGYIYSSSDFGVTWTPRLSDTTRQWSSISISSTGQYQSAVTEGAGGSIFTSTDFGVTWVQRSTATKTNAFTRIKSSASGQYQLATSGPVGNTNGQLYVSSDYGQTWMPRRGLSTWLGGSVSATGAVMMTMASILTLPNAFYLRTGGSNWRDFIPLLTANTTTNLQTWGPDEQFYTSWDAQNEIAKQFSYFAGYWLNRNRVSNGQSFSVPAFSGGSTTFTFTATTNYPVTSYTGSLSSYNNGASYTLQSSTGDGIAAGIAASPQLPTILRSTDYGATFSDIAGTALTGTAYWRVASATNSAATQTALAYGGTIYRSSDTGATWSAAGITIDGGSNTARNWQDVAVAAETGAVQVTCVSGGYLYVSSNTGATWTSSTVSIDGAGTQTTNRAWQAVTLSADGQYGLACVNSTTASGFIYRSINSGASWASSSVVIDGVSPQTTNRAWQDVGMSANGKYQVACVGTSGFIYYSKDYGASWTSLTAAGSRSWSSVALSENGGTISATTNDATGGVWTYTMPDDQYYRPPALLNSGSTTTASTIRAITYGNSGTGALTDGYWVAGADASANTLAYSSNGVDWTAVVGSKTTLFNSVNGVAYGADLWGTMMWVAVGAPFIGSVPGSTAYSIAYSYNMTTWTGVRNLANFTGQGNHVAYGQDEYGTGMWVAVGQGSGVLAANLGSSSLYNSNGGSTGGGTPNTTIFYSYDGTNWSAGTGVGIFAVSGTDVAWGMDASGVATWVASGIGFTDPLTGVFIPGGQVAYSTNGRVWTPIRTPTAIVPAQTPTTISTRESAMPVPPANTGFITPIFGTSSKLGLDIPGEVAGEYSGESVSMSADGTRIAVGASNNTGGGLSGRGITRIYQLNGNTWSKMTGGDIPGEVAAEYSGNSVSMSADGTRIAIGAYLNTGGGLSGRGMTRIYQWNGSTWPKMPTGDISGEFAGEQSGISVSMSADGTRVAVGAQGYMSARGITRIYQWNGSAWSKMPTGDISGEFAGEYSGYSVSMSADGTRVAVGAYTNTGGSPSLSERGMTRIYQWNGSTWSKMTNGDIPGEVASERSGNSVSMSADGTRVAIGANKNTGGGLSERGMVRVYQRIVNVWLKMTGGEIPGEVATDQSGRSVGMSADGTRLAVGATENTGGGLTNRGITRIYQWNGSTWSKMTNGDIPGEVASEKSGTSVSMSADGSRVVVGANVNAGGGLSNRGMARVYTVPTTANAITYITSNPAVAEISNGILLIKDISAGTTTITATQPASPPFSLTPAIVQGTLTVTGTVYTLVYHTVFSIFTPFTTSALSVAYGRGGSQGTGAPLWMVGGSGGNVFAMSSTPTTTGAWSVVSAAAPTANAPFPICNSIGYSNGIWVAGNNTDATNVLARSIDGGGTWTPVPLSSVSGILAGSASVGANAFCNYSLAYADYSNDTNLRSWVAVQGTKNFMFEGGVNTVATVSSNIVASTYGFSSATIPSTVSVMVAPPGALATTYGTSWGQLGLDISGTQASEYTGYSVALSADGTTVAIGSIYYNVTGTYEGRVRVYKYNNVTSSWGQLGLDISGTQVFELSGYSVALSADGTTVAIGSPYYNVTGTDEGRVRVYKLIGTTWTLLGSEILGTQASEQSGYSVSLSADGTTVAIGSQIYDKAGGTTNANTDEGRVRIYKYNKNGTSSWDLLGSVILGTQVAENSGYSVSLSADGTTVAIGSLYYDKAGGTTNANTDEGRTRVYKYNKNGTSSWDQLGLDISGNQANEYSGTSVSLSADGTTVAIGSYGYNVTGTDEGRVRIYKYNKNGTSSWDLLGLEILGTQASEYSGYSVSLSADGTTVAIGSYGYNVTGTDEGRTRVYKYNKNGTSSWDQLGLDISGNQANEYSGTSVSLSADGTTIAIGSYGYDVTGTNNVGRTRIYKIPTTNAITYTSTSSSVADVYGNLLLIKGTNGVSNIVATQGSTTITDTLTVAGTTYTLVYVTNRAWWVAGGAGTSAAGVSSAALAYSTDPSGTTGWTKSTSPAIASLAAINDIAFSPQTQRWLAVGAGASGSSTQNVLFSDASGMTWTASAVATPVTPVITLNTCIWNQLDASASAAGRWLVGGTRNDISVSIPTSASLYISTDTSGAASPWTPIAGTGAILSQVYSAAFNGRVWIAAGVPATDVGSTSTLMRTTDPTGAAGWTGITATASSISGFDTAARSIAWNADQQMWVATGENTGSAADASFSSVIYSLDVSGSVGTWRTVRESNSSCFSGQGNGIAFTGRKWLAVGEGTNQIVATTDVSANTAFGTGAAPTWSSAGNANAALPVRGSDIAFTGRNLIATGVGSGAGSGVVISTDPTGTSWSTAAAGFTDASGGGTSITFEPAFDGTGRLVATGKSATNSISVSSDSGATWNTSATATATAVQFSSRQQTVATTQTLFTTGGNSVAYVGNDTLFGSGGNDVHWSGKRWIATGKNSGPDAATATATATAPPAAVLDITNNNTAPIAVSDDGITWQCVSSSQAPNITEGMFVATNSRIGATPLIDSRITIMDGGDTETMVDYGGGGGGGAGIAQVDIIAELPVTSVSASNTTGTVTTIGVGANNSVNGVGVTPTASFDNTAFTITTRPV